MQDNKYTIQRTGRMIIQRQVIDHVGVIIICENRAAKVLDIAAMTEYGNYCYHWDATSEGVGLLKATDDYLMGKFLSGHDERRVMDWEATTHGLMNAVNAMDELTDGNMYSIRQRCEMSLNECDATIKELVLWGERWELSETDVMANIVYRFGKDAQGFMRCVLPAIRASAKELELYRQTMMC